MNLNQLTITEAKELLKKKEISSSELTKDCFDKIKKNDPEVNSFITICENQALEQAKKSDELINDGEELPLLGIPVSLKDLYLTKGIKTTAASRVLDNYIPQYDATAVKKLKDAGAVIVGKTNCDAWAHGSSGENSDFGPTKNPWNTGYVPGGSSSGSAASVASDMCLASTGTDTGGSIRLPASFCNLVGLKPTYGRVSRYGIISMASSLDTVGHFTKTVEDNALFLSVTAGKDNNDATTPPNPVPNYMEFLRKGVNGFRIGVPKEYFAEGLDSKIKELIEKALKFYEEKGAEIIEISLPYTEYATACYYIIQPAEVSSNLARYDGIRFGNERINFGDEAKRRIMLGTFTLSVGYYDAYYKKAMQIRTLIKEDFEKAFKQVDAIITPVSPTLPWKLGEKIDDPLKMYLSDIFTVTANIAGIPGLSVPVGFVDEFPVGMQILGPMFSEEKLFQIGFAYEQHTQLYKQKPKL
ncbi:MAG: Asp-tRNA(Asn)/Glu-tRNA(Gln) amidotransferase subunit GatA [Actinobacteria bacterium]|nr:Asp-tRNA(Asn)/Glu-tRNA(Gln) amidotransferase subunit GatA [Actinomycetota bacterium]